MVLSPFEKGSQQRAFHDYARGVLIPTAKLVRWLGPWSREDRAPRDVVRTELTLDDEVRAYLYRPRQRPFGAYLIAPGLHYLGPQDPRLDRLARVLSSAGLLVLAPFLRDHLALRVRETCVDDLARAWDAIEKIADGLPPPAIFSISFGSLPATILATRVRPSALVLFGGYADFDASVRFALTGEAPGVKVPFDPLNTPVVYLAALPHLPGDREELARAWRDMVERTWGKAEMKRPGARDAIAREIAGRIKDKELFLEGCGLAPRGRIDEALEACKETYRFADPRPHLARVTCPVVIVHGKDDDVIPWIEAEKIRAALPPGHPHRVLVTGMAGHTGSSLPSPGALAREGMTMLEVVRALVTAPVTP
jgi:pimeloyl-ACP methyl ester carboxylesterase